MRFRTALSNGHTQFMHLNSSLAPNHLLMSKVDFLRLKPRMTTNPRGDHMYCGFIVQWAHNNTQANSAVISHRRRHA